MIKRSKDNRKDIGNLGEQIAKAYLLQQGYQVIEQNWRCKIGEIDIIAQHNENLIFLEVRTRNIALSFGNPAESVNYRKQRKIIRSSQYYLLKYPFDGQIRFDVIAIILTPEHTPYKIDHICNAF